jgi:hypothetical protein
MFVVDFSRWRQFKNFFFGWLIGRVPIIKHETQDEFSQSLEA